MSEYKIEKLDINEYSKCNNIWDMKKCPFTKMFEEEIIRGDRFVYIYKRNGEFIGEGALVINKDDCDYFIPNRRIYLSRMLVKKEYRNQGIGAILLDYLIKQAAGMGYAEIALGVDADNDSAIHLYEKKGFKIIKKDRDEYGSFYKMLKEADNE
ncbi:MAG: GNAT family N-acetyltransferase [Clostridium sp.]|nr:GNAT family N-acetyltransferase [Clostridium sp.]